jgi:hypothetical protein
LRAILLDSVGFEREPDAQGPVPPWVEMAVVDRLRGPGESYSDVILRLVELEAKGKPL